MPRCRACCAVASAGRARRTFLFCEQVRRRAEACGLAALRYAIVPSLLFHGGWEVMESGTLAALGPPPPPHPLPSPPLPSPPRCVYAHVDCGCACAPCADHGPPRSLKARHVVKTEPLETADNMEFCETGLSAAHSRRHAEMLASLHDQAVALHAPPGDASAHWSAYSHSPQWMQLAGFRRQVVPATYRHRSLCHSTTALAPIVQPVPSGHTLVCLCCLNGFNRE